MNFDTKDAEKFIDIEKGCFVGWGVDLRKEKGDPEPVYIDWKVLNAHMMIYGTTRQGKSRLLAFILRQIIEKGDDVCLVEPKGSEGQEMLSWLIQYAEMHGRIEDLMYFSPAFPDETTKINPIYELSNEEISNSIEGLIEADEQFYSDIANEIVMSTLLALSFLEKTLDPMIIEMMRTVEYAKAHTLNRVEKINRQLHKEDYNSLKHHNEFDPRKYFRSEDDTDDEIARINDAYAWVKSYYDDGAIEFPIRTFVTFRDLAVYANHASIGELLGKLKKAYSEAEKRRLSSNRRKESFYITDEDMQLGKEALRELSKVASRDANYFSKVSSTFATTMTKLSSGDIGKMLCDSKINILKDRIFTDQNGVIMMLQPFPLIYHGVANTIVKIFMSMFSSFAGQIGKSGIMTPRRTFILVDEAGAIVNMQIAKNLSNKGGGLKISLGLFSQSIADYVDALGEEGAAILNDNSNTKGFFKVNDSNSAETMSAMIGTKKVGSTSYTSSDNRDGRAQSKAAEEPIIPPYLVSQLKPMVWSLKTDDRIFMMMAPYQEDPDIYIKMPGLSSKSKALKMSAIVDKMDNI